MDNALGVFTTQDGGAHWREGRVLARFSSPDGYFLQAAGGASTERVVSWVAKDAVADTVRLVRIGGPWTGLVAPFVPSDVIAVAGGLAASAVLPIDGGTWVVTQTQQGHVAAAWWHRDVVDAPQPISTTPAIAPVTAITTQARDVILTWLTNHPARHRGALIDGPALVISHGSRACR